KRLYKGSEVDKIVATFQIEAEALRVLSDTSSSASKTHLKMVHKIHGSQFHKIEQFTEQTISSLSTECRKETA
ncbi:MAG TPA: hypothetical protein PLD88_14965, partial [Candidatus Berkiella sp.]|nr:hypothetical protein [Candidatus Berkiella sp.]